MMQETHRSGLLKQSNKSHKTGGHRSKGALEAQNRGRVSLKASSTSSKKASSHKVQLGRDRKHQAQQLRTNKKENALALKRSLGGTGYPPILTVIVDLDDNEEEEENRDLINELTNPFQDEAVITKSDTCTHLGFPRFKQRFAFIQTKSRDFHRVLDVAKVCDCLIFTMSSENFINGHLASKDTLISSLMSQGLISDPILVIKDTDQLSHKQLNDIKKNVAKTIAKRYPFMEDKKNILSWPKQTSDSLLILRHLGSVKRKHNHLRERRPYIFGDHVSRQDSTLKVTGYVRCADLTKRLSVNRLVHIPGVGSFQLDKIESAVDNHPMAKDRHSNEMDDENHEIVTLCEADPTILESLISENEPDDMDGEQTWPTEEELNEAAKEQQKKKVIKKVVPKGTSDYQAAWILDGEEIEEEDDEDESDEDEDEDMEEYEEEEDDDDDNDEELEQEDDEEYETLELADDENKGAYDEKNVNLAEESETLKKIKEARMDEMFPDEIDTPMDQNAKIDLLAIEV